MVTGITSTVLLGTCSSSGSGTIGGSGMSGRAPNRKLGLQRTFYCFGSRKQGYAGKRSIFNAPFFYSARFRVLVGFLVDGFSSLLGSPGFLCHRLVVVGVLVGSSSVVVCRCRWFRREMMLYIIARANAGRLFGQGSLIDRSHLLNSSLVPRTRHRRVRDFDTMCSA